MARVEIELQISFFSFGFARVTEVRHVISPPKHNAAKVSKWQNTHKNLCKTMCGCVNYTFSI